MEEAAVADGCEVAEASSDREGAEPAVTEETAAWAGRALAEDGSPASADVGSGVESEGGGVPARARVRAWA